MADNIDPTSPLAQLKPELLEIVRLVADLKNSKEIAERVGSTHHVVDNRLKEISRILGISGRKKVAQLYRAATEPAPQPIDFPDTKDGNQSPAPVYQSPELPKHIAIGNGRASPGEQDRSDDRSAATLHQSQAPYVASFQPWPESRSWISVLLEAAQTNELTPLVRTVCISITTLAAICSLAFLINLAEGLSRIS